MLIWQLQALIHNHQMVVLCISNGLMQGLGFLLLLLAGKFLDMLLACACVFIPFMLLWGHTLRAVLAGLGFLILTMPLCLSFVKPPPVTAGSLVKCGSPDLGSA